MLKFQRTLLFASLAILANLFAAPVFANDGDPIAVRRWPDGAISVETHWGLHIVVDPSEQTGKLLPRKADQVVRTKKTIAHTLSRQPNQEKPEWKPLNQDQSKLNTVQIQSILSPPGSSQALAMFADGATLIFVPHRVLASPDAIEKVIFPYQSVDLLVLSTSDSSTLTKPQITKFVSDVKPRKILLNVSGELSKTDLTSFQTAIGADKPVTAVGHNTLAISKPKNDKKDATSGTSHSVEVVTLTDKPWEMPDDLSKLFVAMEKSCADSQKVFAKLSVDQMNFKPSNGTHTPRWNTEHMMGRQLGFFSQIYNKIDSSIPVLDLNPKQMPPDYRFAHPDWDGKEEARQMQRVSEFTRRFAYLLDGLDVNKRAPGSRWPSLKALLVQMFRHYTEHTGNTVKKFDLPDFPKK